MIMCKQAKLVPLGDVSRGNHRRKSRTGRTVVVYEEHDIGTGKGRKDTVYIIYVS
jgi:hypothetical protein